MNQRQLVIDQFRSLFLYCVSWQTRLDSRTSESESIKTFRLKSEERLCVTQLLIKICDPSMMSSFAGFTVILRIYSSFLQFIYTSLPTIRLKVFLQNYYQLVPAEENLRPSSGVLMKQAWLRMVTGYPVSLTLHQDSVMFSNIYWIIYRLPAQSPPQMPTTKVLYSVSRSSMFMLSNFLRWIAFLFLVDFGVLI